jgi:hypothetical protein
LTPLPISTKTRVDEKETTNKIDIRNKIARKWRILRLTISIAHLKITATKINTINKLKLQDKQINKLTNK